MKSLDSSASRPGNENARSKKVRFLVRAYRVIRVADFIDRVAARLDELLDTL